MAELVAGAFLQSSFQVIFEKLASVHIRDYFSSDNVDALAKELDHKLNSINHVLEEAELKQYQNKYVKKWLDELKHVVYEADQLLDEISTDAMIYKLKAESEPLTTNLFGWVSALTGNPFESRLNKLLETLESLAQQTKRLGLEVGPCASNEGLVSWKPSKRLSSTSLVDESSLCGRDVHKEKLVKLLLADNTSGNQVPIISIVGLGGMGKTTLAQHVYNDNMTKKHFELKAWVYVSESFDDVGLTKAILKSFNPSADGEYLDQLQHQLQHLLMAKKYLLVLDDIWNGKVEYWDKLLLPLNHGSSGSKIIVTTREKKVADHVLNSTELIHLHQLDKSNCWSLFETHAFQGMRVCDYPKLETIGMKIVDKCGGLPLAIKSLGQLLRKKFSQDEWMEILETDMWRLSDRDHTINSVLRLSYHNLPSNLKRCFAYCSIFPKGYKFKKDKLIKLWMAEGLLKCYGLDKSEEDFGNEIFGDLESISFFQKSFYEIKGTTYEDYVMHDLVNDLAKSVSREFCMQIEGVRVEGLVERTRHIQCSFQLHCDDDLLEQICELKGLRSLMIRRGMCITNNMQHDLFSRLKCLRMLTFSGCLLSELVDEISNLKLLRYLDLSYNKIASLPDTICMLYNLQTLLLKGCHQLTELPSNFSKLINLRHLELPCIKKMPKNMGKLSNLQTLSYFIVEAHNESDLKDLAKLNHLHGTIHIKGLGNVSDTADAATLNLKDIEELHTEFNGGREEMAESNLLVLEAIQSNSNLKKLNITRYKGSRFPNWRDCHLPNLVSLQLKDCRCSCLPTLGQLPSLKKLSIYDCEGIKIIDEDFYGNNSTIVPFKSLQYLRFQDMVNWEEWICVRFPLLKELYIKNCPKLKSTLPQHLSSLQKLKISDCNELEELLCLGEFPLLKEISISFCPELKRALHQHLPSLQKLEIRNCNKLEELLCLGEFPLLKEISIRNCPELKRALPQHLPSLQKLDVFDCNELEELLCLGEFPLLKEISIRNCPELKRALHQHLPSLQKLEIRNCNKLEELLCLGEFPLLKEISIRNCPELKRALHQHLPSLQNLEIRNCNKLEELLCLGEFPLLKEISIRNCPELKRALPQHLPSLQKLDVFDCNELQELLCLGEFPLLKEISISFCPELKRALHQHLPSLQKLEIRNCNKLEELLCLGEFPLLKEISITNCPELKRALPQHLPSLQKLDVFDCNELQELLCLGEFPLLKEISISFCPELKRALHQHLPSLQKLEIRNCNKLEELLCLGEFPLLKEISIRNCPELKRALPQHLPSLQKLDVFDCNELEELLCLGEFPLLKEISIRNCPELKRALPQHLPSLQKLKISNCNKMEASIPKCDNMIELDIQSCDRILVNELPTSLKKLLLWQNRNTEFSVDQNLINFPFLEDLKLDFRGCVNCPSLDLRCYNFLRDLSIKGWCSSSLPLELHLFTSLRSLRLYDCPELESFPMGGLPSNLRDLGIYNCPRLIGSREEWGLFQLNSLRYFFVSDEFENVESFPEENLLPPTLDTLDLYDCSKLRIMNNKGFLHLKSLKYLYIEDCPSLESLPEKEDLPNSLTTLWIEGNCGIIKEKYEKEGGELWHTISHIPCVYID
ncbi:NB-ARC domain disease resistance protein, putative [Medicago truncatula]|uniref:NB-ARC domain disease resistance protein, putative n=1 Tax=Medicago truncatula TaxID=3880 RepID=G7IZ67_MEDTR|nr:NB-ARC domain disease resistance protein, putative [Medicago truncatula]